jgi:Flp pilus assembly protein TadG
MLAFQKMLQRSRGQALVELTLTMPLLLVLALGVVEFSNMINAYLVMTHVTREGANLASRLTGTKGSTAWVNGINGGLNNVISGASPVIKSTNTAQWEIMYSMVAWNAAANCGSMTDGSPDRYVISRDTAPNDPQWTYGALSQASQLGANGSCASAALPEVKDLSTQGLTFHVIEVFYDYGPSQLTPIGNFIGGFVPGTFYARTMFMDVTGF